MQRSRRLRCLLMNGTSKEYVWILPCLLAKYLTVCETERVVFALLLVSEDHASGPRKKRFIFGMFAPSCFCFCVAYLELLTKADESSISLPHVVCL